MAEQEFRVTRWLKATKARRAARHRHVYMPAGYGGAGWTLVRCACGAEEISN